MYKSFADLESGLDFFQTVSKNRHSRNLPFCFLQTGKTLLFIMLKNKGGFLNDSGKYRKTHRMFSF